MNQTVLLLGPFPRASDCSILCTSAMQLRYASPVADLFCDDNDTFPKLFRSCLSCYATDASGYSAALGRVLDGDDVSVASLLADTVAACAGIGANATEPMTTVVGDSSRTTASLSSASTVSSSSAAATASTATSLRVVSSGSSSRPCARSVHRNLVAAIGLAVSAQLFWADRP